jgi:hypothetical protein
METGTAREGGALLVRIRFGSKPTLIVVFSLIKTDQHDGSK